MKRTILIGLGAGLLLSVPGTAHAADIANIGQCIRTAHAAMAPGQSGTGPVTIVGQKVNTPNGWDGGVACYLQR